MRLIAIDMVPEVADKEAWMAYHKRTQKQGYCVNTHVFMGEEAAESFEAWLAEAEPQETPRRRELDTLHLDPGGLVWTGSEQREITIEGCKLTWSLCHTDTLLALLQRKAAPAEYALEEGYVRIPMMSGNWTFGLPGPAAEKLIEALHATLEVADLETVAQYAKCDKADLQHFLPRKRHRKLLEEH